MPLPPEQSQEPLRTAFDQMYHELYRWREAHPEASFDEIVQQVTPRRQRLMGLVVEQLACQHGRGEVVAGWRCEECGAALVYKGRSPRQVEHLEGETPLHRAYYHCPHCESGLFPPRSSVETDQPQLEPGDGAAGPAAGGRDPLV